MTPQETIFMMMRSCPSLNKTRSEALFNLFNDPSMSWEKGELIFDRLDMKFHLQPYQTGEHENIAGHQKMYHDAERAYCNKRGFNDNQERLQLESARKNYLRILRDQKENQFTFDHADLLCQCETSDTVSVFSYNPLGFIGHKLADLPNNVTTDWLSAAKELAIGLRQHKFIESLSNTEEKNISDQESLLASQKVANQFLERVGALQIDPKIINNRINALKKEAEALGLPASLIEAMENCKQQRKTIIFPVVDEDLSNDNLDFNKYRGRPSEQKWSDEPVRGLRTETGSTEILTPSRVAMGFDEIMSHPCQKTDVNEGVRLLNANLDEDEAINHSNIQVGFDDSIRTANNINIVIDDDNDDWPTFNLPVLY